MRWKFEREDLEIYRCCFCCHVRTGTLALGILNLFGHLIGLTFFIVAVAHPELIQRYLPEGPVHHPPTPQPELNLLNLGGPATPRQSELGMVKLGDSGADGSSVIVISGGNVSRVSVLPSEPDINRDVQDLQAWVYSKNWSTESLVAAMMLTVASMVIALCLIYGTIRGIAKYITPFFCVQMFDLCLSGLTMLSYFSDLPAVRRWIAAQGNLPFKEQLLAMDNDHLTLLTLIIFVGTLSVKAYFIGVVWSCYKYLKTYEMISVAQAARLRVYDREETLTNPEDTEMLLPPKYEDVIAMPVPEQSPPPPAYSNHQ